MLKLGSTSEETNGNIKDLISIHFQFFEFNSAIHFHNLNSSIPLCILINKILFSCIESQLGPSVLLME